MNIVKGGLAEYLHWRTQGGSGWMVAYEAALGNHSGDWWGGYYRGLLEDALRILGPERIAALLAAAEAVDRRLQEVADQEILP